MTFNYKHNTLQPLVYLLLMVSTSAIAEVIETIEYKNYVISPRTVYEIKPELMRNTPIRDRRGSYNGHTDWYIDWQYKTRQEASFCRILQTQTKIHIVHILPILNEQVTDKQTIDVFNQFNTALTEHEKNHGNNGRLAAEEIDKALNNIQTQQNCRYVARMIDDIGRSIVQKYAKADSEYDQVTQNGLTEGAVIY